VTRSNPAAFVDQITNFQAVKPMSLAEFAQLTYGFRAGSFLHCGDRHQLSDRLTVPRDRQRLPALYTVK